MAIITDSTIVVKNVLIKFKFSYSEWFATNTIWEKFYKVLESLSNYLSFNLIKRIPIKPINFIDRTFPKFDIKFYMPSKTSALILKIYF